MQSKVISSAVEDVSPPAVEVVAPRRSGLSAHVPLWIRVLLGNPLAVVGCVIFAIIFLAAVFAPLIAGHSPTAMLGPLGSAPSRSHWLGTNDQGQDIFAQVVYGARFSLAVGLITGFAIAFLATFVGMIAGYSRAWLDDGLTLLMNIFLIIPQLPLLVVISVYIPLRGNNAFGAVLLMAAVITITGWAWGGRVIRSQTLTLRGRDFVKAAKVSGESTRRIIFLEMLPNMTSLIVNTIIMSSMGAILTEAALDYLGIGNLNQVTWGTMLYRAQSGSALFTGEWWAFVFPGLAIAMTTMSMILMNYGVDAISNPRLRSVKGLRRRARAATQARESVEPSVQPVKVAP